MANLSRFISTPSPAQPASDPLSYNLEDIKNHFDAKVAGYRSISDTIISGLSPNQFDTAKNLWQSQIMLTCTSLDYYLHRFFIYALYSMYTGKWSQTTKFTTEELTPLLPQLQRKSADKAKLFFLSSIQKKYLKESFLSYVTIGKIADMCDFSLTQVLKQTFKNPNNAKSVFTQLSDMINQRNRLMHNENINLKTDTPEYLGETTAMQFMEDASNMAKAFYDLGCAKET